MKNYSVRFIKNGEVFDTVVKANNANEARNYIAQKYSIDTHIEFVGDYLKGDENNHVGAVMEV